MNTFDFILPAHSNALSSDCETSFTPSAAKKSVEPFDSLMNRALNRPPRAPEEKAPALKKPARDARSSHAPKSEAGPTRKSKPAARPETDSSGAATATGNSDAAAREAAPVDQDKDLSRQDSESTTTSAATTEPSAIGNGDPTDGGAAAALQSLVVNPVVPPTVSPVVSPPADRDISKTGGSGTSLSLVATVTSQPDMEIYSPAAATAGTPENGAKSAENIFKPGGNEAANRKELSATATDPAKNSATNDGAVPVPALLEQARKVEETPANIADAAAGKPHPPGLDAAGTSAAKPPLTMKHADPADKVAGMPEQNLPGVTVISALQSAAHPKPAARTAARVESADAPATANVASADRAPSTSETSSNSSISASSQTELRLRALDRTHDIVALQGLRLKETNAGSLHVVIKPGAGVQLSLQLKQTGDGIEARAILQQGDFKQLNQHWAELQQRLEERGIKLAPLGQDGSAMNPGGENFQRSSHPSAEQNSLSAGAFAEFASAGAGTTRPVPVAAVSSRGWEGWA